MPDIEMKMPDIIERLRERHGDIEANEAADEIERLRAAKHRWMALVDERAKQVAELHTALDALLDAMDNMHERGEIFTTRVSVAASHAREVLKQLTDR
jgi:hypothetical protein